MVTDTIAPIPYKKDIKIRKIIFAHSIIPFDMEIESIFLNVWLSYSTFMEELAIIPNTIGSMRKKPNSMANIF